MKVYKLIRKEVYNGAKFSLFVNNNLGYVEYSTQYTTVPRPNCGPLAAFKTLKNAKAFINNICGDDIELWESEAILAKTRRKSLWYPRHPNVPPNTKLSSGLVDVRLDLPAGTVLCSAIQLTKRLKFKK